jgi:hypothetical protein
MRSHGPACATPLGRVWTLTETPKRLECELRDDGEYGCEAQLFEMVNPMPGRRFPDRAHAVAHAAAIRALPEGGGWVPASC